jgi:PhzF family phenazine biosynthesis protein
MPRPFVQVDAFTDRPFQGNPAAVFLLEGPQDPSWMQLVAREMNLSETAFLHRLPEGFGLRWFTPAVEVDLCGHATLASAHALWSEGHADPGTTLRFFTRSGELTASREGDWITLDFPATGPSPCEPPEGLLPALGAEAVYVGKTRFDYLAELTSEEAVRGLRPDGHRLRSLGVRGVIVTAPGASPYDFVSRFFAPGAGIDEDPVTGSAHCALGPYWQGRTGKGEFLAYQASARGGEVRVRTRGDRVLLSGRAVTVLRGDLL